MFKDTDEYPRFASAILSALQSETEGSDIEHLCELVAQMAINGDEVAANALRSRVLGQPFTHEDYQYGCHALVLVEGVDAVVELARRFGQVPFENPDDMSPLLSYLTEGTSILPVAEAELQRLAETDDAIRAFLNNEKSCEVPQQDDSASTKEERQKERRERVRRELPIEKILDAASAGVGVRPFEYTSFGTYATAEELEVVLLRLVAAGDEKTCLRLLQVFRRAPLPELHPMIWQLAESKSDDVRAAAITALAQCRDQSVGDFARAALRSADSSRGVAEGLETLVKNYQSGDTALIMSALARISASDDDAHAIGFSILRICDDHDSPDLSAILEWVYESNPCGLCRDSVVRHLIDAGALPTSILSECLHDANDEVRQLAREAAGH
ncbi:HEAT repeat domain-containing protein [Paraburkholderia sediminicola]|uniref:HEAT repeat domain-containing protein n=1 Tax=Paraburkholderia sediminicola TaxID=458836 RepID=UPI0038B6B372